MPNEKRNKARENISHSVLQSPHRTSGRKRQEKRVGSGNFRAGQAKSEKEVNRSDAAGRPQARKRAASR